MSKKNGSIMYKCSNCGYSQPRWLGRCPECNEWNSLEEIIIDNLTTAKQNNNQTEVQKPVLLSNIDPQINSRIISQMPEFDQVLGGGLTKRSAILLGGEPGIGKSTLLLQISSQISQLKDSNYSVLYVSGEESAGQIKERALRLKINTDKIQILCTSRLEDILFSIDKITPTLLIIDSIQTIYSIQAGIIPGTVNQLKYCANELISWVKERDSILIMTAHVTKEGTIAGPKSLEHMVDTVISFDRNNDDIRFLQCSKNRFGPVDELGIFSMTEQGLIPFKDPTTLFLTKRTQKQPAGVITTPIIEGSRVFIVEIQALTVPAKASLSRVYSEKIDNAKISRIAAVIEKRCGLVFSDQDIYINVAGGIKLSDSSIDSAIACALYSARTDIAIDSNTCVFGELSLAGEIRPVNKGKQRIKAAKNMNYTNILCFEDDANCTKIQSIKELVQQIFKN